MPATPASCHTAGVGRLAVLVVPGLLVLAANLIVVFKAHVAFATPMVGFAALIGVPTFFFYVIDPGRWAVAAERWFMAFVLTLLTVLVVGLAINEVLPHIGVARPLDTLPVTVTFDVTNLALALWACVRFPDSGVRASWRRPNGRALTLLMGGAAVVALAIMGAVRLDNGAGGGLTLFSIALLALLTALAYRWRDSLGPNVLPAFVYAAGLTLLLVTSMRGWYTTGHDIQHEMNVFLATQSRGRWTIDVHDAYNSCLSITILPTIVSRWTRVADPYVFKVFGQMMYATCPVAVYLLVRRISGEAIGLLSAVYFIGFVGFVQDMPFLNRQEIAFVFFTAAILSLFIEEHSFTRRRIIFEIVAPGMILSHYSTTYFALAAFAISWALSAFVRAVARRHPKAGERRSLQAFSAEAGTPTVLTGLMVLGLAVAAVVWVGPLTRSGSGLGTDLSGTWSALAGKATALKDPGASYALLSSGGSTASEAQTVRDVSRQLATLRAKSPAAFYDVPLPTPATVPNAAEPNLPLSSLGRWLHSLGIPVDGLNARLREAIAGSLQLFLLIGLLAVVFSRRWAQRIRPQFLALSLGMTVPIVLQTLLPVISLDYGIGRSFMQALVVLAPLVVIGTLVVASWLRRIPRAAAVVAPATALVYFGSSTGMVPQALGAYGPQLHLNNAGEYYNHFYSHSGDVAVLEWVQGHLEQSPNGALLDMDPGALNRSLSVGDLVSSDDILPSAIPQNAYVVLDYENIVDHRAELSEVNYELWYDYPFATLFLDTHKDLVYNNGTARVYR